MGYLWDVLGVDLPNIAIWPPLKYEFKEFFLLSPTPSSSSSSSSFIIITTIEGAVGG